MSDEHEGDEPAIHPEHLAKPEPLREVLHDVAKHLGEFLEGEPPDGAKDEGHIEGGSAAP